jgi:prepilin peptidase CpaA
MQRMLANHLMLIPDLVAVALCGVAAAIDLRHHRIPNWLTFSGAAAGLLINTIVFAIHGGWSHGLSAGLLPALAGGGVALVVFFVLGAIGAVGMGDVKLMAAAGGLLRWPVALGLLAFVVVSGGVLALAYALIRGKFRAVIRNIFRLTGRDRKRVELHRIPYGLAIFAGCAAAVLARHLEGFPPLGG